MREFRNLNWTAITGIAIVLMSLQCAYGEPVKPADADITATVSMIDGTVRGILRQQFSMKRDSLWIKGFHGRGKIFFAKLGS